MYLPPPVPVRVPPAGFDSALTQQVLVSGTLGTVQLHDFVVPRHELRCAFTVTGDHRLREHETYDDTRRDEVTVHLDMPQVGAPGAAPRRRTAWQAPALLLPAAQRGEGARLAAPRPAGRRAALREVPDPGAVEPWLCLSTPKSSCSRPARDLEKPAHPLCLAPTAQEAHMWETFAGLVQRCQAGGQPDPFWPRATELTQRVLFAVDQSARDGCRTVELSW